MKQLLVTIILTLVCFSSTQGQDLIVTDKGDSLNCKITKIKGDYIHFTFKYEGEIRSTLLPTTQVKYYQKDFFDKAEVPKEKIIGAANYSKIRINVVGGWSYLTAKVSDNVPSDFRQYVKELKSGYHFGGDINFFTSENIGFGLKYIMFRTQNELNGIYTVDLLTGQVRTGKLKDDITVHYFGPSLCTRVISANKKTHFISNLSLGYMSYLNNATVIDNFTLTSSTLGLLWDLSADFMLDDNLALGLGLSFTLGTLNKYKINDGTSTETIKLDTDNLESISRMDISVGLKWYK